MELYKFKCILHAQVGVQPTKVLYTNDRKVVEVLARTIMSE